MKKIGLLDMMAFFIKITINNNNSYSGSLNFNNTSTNNYFINEFEKILLVCYLKNNNFTNNDERRYNYRKRKAKIFFWQQPKKIKII